VVATAAVEGVSASGSGWGVIAAASDDVFDSGQSVGAGLGTDQLGNGQREVDGGVGGGAGQVVGVAARATGVGVVAVVEAGDEGVVARAAGGGVIAAAAGDDVGAIAAAALDVFGQGVAGEEVATRTDGDVLDARDGVESRGRAGPEVDVDGIGGRAVVEGIGGAAAEVGVHSLDVAEAAVF